MYMYICIHTGRQPQVHLDVTIKMLIVNEMLMKVFSTSTSMYCHICEKLCEENCVSN